AAATRSSNTCTFTVPRWAPHSVSDWARPRARAVRNMAGAVATPLPDSSVTTEVSVAKGYRAPGTQSMGPAHSTRPRGRTRAAAAQPKRKRPEANASGLGCHAILLHVIVLLCSQATLTPPLRCARAGDV